MTEEEWQTCTVSKDMVAFLRNKVTLRKNRLFSAACCRRVWHLYRNPAIEAAIRVGELFADGKASEEERRAALKTIHGARAQAASGSARQSALQAAGFTCMAPSASWPLPGGSDVFSALTAGISDPVRLAAAREREERAQCDLLRDLFSHLFYRGEFAARWRTRDVIGLATTIYEELAFAQLPVLGDALEEAGCEVGVILGHLRGAGVHARGCWVVDLVLERE